MYDLTKVIRLDWRRVHLWEYYTVGDATVDADYATTTETWQVAYINDRRRTPRGLAYCVLWVHPNRSCKRLYLRTWEPRERLTEDDFEVEMDLVDLWKTSKFDTFEAFWKQDKVGFGLLGADGEGLCPFNALKGAAQLAGRPGVITQQDIDHFVRDELVLYKRDLTKGATSTTVLRFLRRFRDDGRDFIDNAIAKYNYAIPGRRGARVLKEIKLNDVIYIVAAYNFSFVGHGFVVTVQGKTRLISRRR
ncbi:unnamed protein product [Phytophthora fragariaefolia]|uniref:Unnamed protein product n=1 Tax=Phytophthora fragariaefolia TaxID=1490495 RepID=A0A9W6XGW2_9STRA|nr:unnamed protein product [Phytophthora fragariaefolia]